MFFDGETRGMRRGLGLRFRYGSFAMTNCRYAPQGDFLCEQKVTKESHRERVFRLPLSL